MLRCNSLSGKGFRIIGAIILAGSLALSASLRCAGVEPPLGSRAFLSRHVHSVTELQQELDQDPRLLQAYASLLGWTPEQVKTEFARLKLKNLDKDQVFKVYGVYGTVPDLHYSYKVRRLPKGIRVFTLEDGETPVVLVQCGNLLRGFYTTPAPVANTVPLFNEMSPDAGLASTANYNTNIQFEAPVEGGGDWMGETAPVAPLAGPVPPELVHRARPLWWPWLFPLAGLPFIGGGGGGSRGGSPFTIIPSPPLFDTGTTSIASVVEAEVFDVPEPGARLWLASLMAISVSAIVWRRTRRRRKTQP